MVPDETPTTERVADAVLAEMARQKISQAELSERSGVPRVTLQRRLSGFSSFTVEEVDRIGQALGVGVIALVTGSAA